VEVSSGFEFECAGREGISASTSGFTEKVDSQTNLYYF